MWSAERSHSQEVQKMQEQKSAVEETGARALDERKAAEDKAPQTPTLVPLLIQSGSITERGLSHVAEIVA